MPVKRKTISLSRNTLPALYGAVADILKEDTPLSDALTKEIMKRIDTPHKISVEVTGFYDKKVPDEEIKKQLDALSFLELHSLVNRYNLDPGRSLGKTSDKSKIIPFVIDQRQKLLTRYSGFEIKNSISEEPSKKKNPD